MRYVLEGSLRHASDRIRITAQPTDVDIVRIAADYFTPWRFWNWVRAFASTGAVAALAMVWREGGRRSVKRLTGATA